MSTFTLPLNYLNIVQKNCQTITCILKTNYWPKNSTQNLFFSFAIFWNTDKRELWLNAFTETSSIWISKLGFIVLLYAFSFVLRHPWISQVLTPGWIQICTENCQSPPILTHKWRLNLKTSLRTDKSQHLGRKQTKSLTFVEIVNHQLQICR